MSSEPNSNQANLAGLRWRWVVATTLGHLAGAACWALPAAWLWHGPGEGAGPASPFVMFALTIVAAAAQGALLGVAQGFVLRRVSSVRIAGWTLASIVGVVGGWLVIVVGAPAAGNTSTSVWTLAGLVALGGVVFGALVGGAQRQALNVAGPFRWVAGNALGWCIALLVTVGVLRVFDGSSAVMVGAFSAIAAGMIIGLVTATQLRSITNT